MKTRKEKDKAAWRLARRFNVKFYYSHHHGGDVSFTLRDFYKMMDKIAEHGDALLEIVDAFTNAKIYAAVDLMYEAKRKGIL